MNKVANRLALAALLGYGAVAPAALTVQGNGTVYDSVLDISWDQDGNAVKTLCDANDPVWQTFNPAVIANNTGRDKDAICAADGVLNWFEAEAWVAHLNLSIYKGIANWRQWTVAQQDYATCNYGCTGSELGHLFNALPPAGLGNPNNLDDSCWPPGCLEYTGPFSNFQTTYWSGTENASSPGLAWTFYPYDGRQGSDTQHIQYHVWAVRPGQVAEVFCVNTAGDLQSALTTAASNGVDDEVRIEQGTYVGNFVYASTQVNKLSVLGGYTPGCGSREIAPKNTVLDGNQTGTVLKLAVSTVAAEFVVEGLTLRKGTSSDGGGLSVVVGTHGAVTLNGNKILENNSVYYGGGVYVHAPSGTLNFRNNSIERNIARYGVGVYAYAGTITLTSNIIQSNSGYLNENPSGIGGGVALETNTATLINNTMVDNTAPAGGGLWLYLRWVESAGAALYNNLFWGNSSTNGQGADLYIESGRTNTPVTLLSNNFDQAEPTGFRSTLPITIDPSNLNQLGPLFVDASKGDFHLQLGSPMIDAGYPGTPDLPEFDIEGTPRVLGNSVDIGAYEYDDGSDPKAILSLTLAGSGSGTVTSNPTGINCGSDCSEYYPQGQSVTLTATPGVVATFTGWSGDADCADGQVTMTTNLNCTATFSQNSYTVTATAGANGSISPASQTVVHGATTTFTVTPTTGYSASVSGCAGTLAGTIYTTGPITAACTVTATFTLNSYSLSTAVSPAGAGLVNCTAYLVPHGGASTCTATATANTGYSFGFWSGDCAGATCALTNITSNKSVTANFARNSYTLSVTKAGTGSGTVTSAPGSINCGTNCQEAFDHGATVTLTATPDATATFTGWSGDCTGTESCQVTLEEAKSVTATFAQIGYTVTATAGTGGGISPASQSVLHGATTSFTVTPTSGYLIGTVNGCGGSLAGSTYTTGPITAACTVTATFSQNSYTVTASAGANGSIGPASQTVVHGATTTFTVTPTTGYSASVSGCAGTLAGTIYTTGPITAACTVTATFTLNSYSLSTAVTPAGAGTVNCTATTIGYGGASTCTATAHAGYSFGFWSGDCAGVTCALTNITSNKSVTANFARNSYTLSVTKAGTGSGTVTSAPGSINCGTNCQEAFDHGATVTLTATPDATSTFTGWSGACTGAESCQVTLEEARRVTATFAQISFIVVTARGGTGGSISPATRSVVPGATTTFTVTPTAGYRIGTVSGCGGSLAGSTYTTGAISGACRVSASFTLLPKYTLTVTKDGTGTVASTPPGISCGSDCREAYSTGTSVTLTATAGKGYQFDSWTGCTSVSDNTCTVAMTSTKRVKATFKALPKDTLVVTKSGTGAVGSSPAGVNCGYTCRAVFTSGTPVTLTATAGKGYQFDSWTGCNSVSGNTCTVAMTGAKSVKATFTLLPKYTLTVTKGGTGTVTSAPAGISCGSDCSQAYSSGTSVKLTATARKGYQFASWSGCNSVSGNSCMVAMTGIKAVKAEFMPAYTLSLAKSGYRYGTVTSAPSGISCGTTCSAKSALFASGATVTLTATPIAGRRFKNWSGACKGVATSCAVPMTKAQSVTAVFQ